MRVPTRIYSANHPSRVPSFISIVLFLEYSFHYSWCGPRRPGLAPSCRIVRQEKLTRWGGIGSDALPAKVALTGMGLHAQAVLLEKPLAFREDSVKKHRQKQSERDQGYLFPP
eukprot:jgi/Bigna1/62598/fgenesh1_kg.38_\